jgi:hypothetical protein
VPQVEVINTTLSTRHRTVSVLLDNGVTQRYCLMRRQTGEVGWVLDSFTTDVVGAPLTWAAHGGALRVADVLDRLPGAAREVRRWTEQEIEDGVDVVEVDLFSRDRRRRALERLVQELAEADAASAA